MKTYKDYAKAFEAGRTVFIVGQINPEAVTDFRRQVKEALQTFGEDTPKDEPVIIVLQTRGGSVEDGVALYNEIQILAQLRKVHLVCQGYVASIGVTILFSVPVEQRFIFPNSYIYCHWNTSELGTALKAGPTQHEYERNQYTAAIDNLKETRRKMVRLYAAGTKLTKTEVNKLFNEPRFLDPQDACALGFTASIIKK